jgi:hypothetical protein
MGLGTAVGSSLPQAVGVALADANPKNLMLAISGAATIAATGISGAQQSAAYAIFAFAATIGVAIPVGVNLIGGAIGARSG